MNPMRFTLLPLLLAGALFACGDEDPVEPDGPSPYESMLLGGDVSALARIEAGGSVFRDDGQPTDALAALVAHGSNAFRLRLFVDPSGAEVQVNDLPYTIALAERVKAAGATLMLDFHYSDTWADPSKQFIPAAWDSVNFDVLEQQVEAYSADVIAQLKDAGVLPDIVQIGNEIDGGLLWPLGKIGWEGYDEPVNYERFGRLLKAGIRGVRSALGPDDDVRIMLHYSQGASLGGTQWFFDHVEAQDVPYDMIGLSWYPYWHGTLAQLEANLEATALRYGKDIVVVETSYHWRSGWTPPAARAGWQAWPLTRDGQARFLRDLLDVVAATPNDLGAGVVWWYPEAIRTTGLFVWGDGALALFDDEGEILPAASVFGGD
ncbi:MAG TPA: glycosyl hydrolase 53 family protein [Longimicrobiales bacterium]|nr:glycosyl hydrolase 53 family protein [Longimicrobiales bacterium]